MRNSSEGILERPVFIVGFSRSGTTWVYDILAAHPEVAGILESWIFTPTMGLSPLLNDNHWPSNPTGLGQLISKEELIPEIKEFIQNLFKRALKPGHRLIIEKSPSHLERMGLIRRVFPRARFIHVIRDGRDVAASAASAARSWAPLWKKMPLGRSYSSCAAAWAKTVAKGRVAGQALGEDYFEIRFEDIEMNPKESYRRLFNFCGLDFDDALLEAVFQKTDFALNFHPNVEGFRRQGRSGEWKRSFNLLDRAFFNFKAGGLLKELGYGA